MNTTVTALSSPAPITVRTRLAGASFATVLTLAMLLGINTLAQVDPEPAQMAQAQPAALAASAQS